MKKLIPALLLLLCARGANAQATQYQINPPAPNAQLLVCPSPDNGYPCPSPVTIYSDSGLSVPVNYPIQLGPSGFFSFYVTAGNYVIQLLGPGYNSSNRKLVTIGSGGGGSGTVSSGTTNTLAKYTAATTVGNSLVSDDGTTLTYTGTGGISSTPTGGVGGTLTLPEGTTASASVSNDVCYGDSTAHAVKCAYNNGSFLTVPQVIASGTSAMGTSAISSGTCATVVTTAATGTATTDAIIWNPNADPTGVTGYAVSASGSVYIWAYPTSGNVNFKVCNNTSGSLTPGALTLNWRVVR